MIEYIPPLWALLLEKVIIETYQGATSWQIRTPTKQGKPKYPTHPTARMLAFYLAIEIGKLRADEVGEWMGISSHRARAEISRARGRYRSDNDFRELCDKATIAVVDTPFELEAAA